tara:strand:+ start:8551 stop:9279 length:729 start_codon:yes stop_codon:yes gene_type:complete
MMQNINSFYAKRMVNKPWGYEYVIYNDLNKLAVTFLYIKHGRKTSLHSHPQKKTGFIILQGKASVQIGIYKKNTKLFGSLSRLVFRPGLFHSLKATTKKGLYALEFEAPYKKNDLLRFKDNYGRQKKKYEGKKYTKKIFGTDLIRFKKPKIGKKNLYHFNNIEVLIETCKNLRRLKNDNSSSAILSGKIIDHNGQDVITAGEVVKTSTLKILSKQFKIFKNITILRVSKKKNKNIKKNRFIG